MKTENENKIENIDPISEEEIIHKIVNYNYEVDLEGYVDLPLNEKYMISYSKGQVINKKTFRLIGYDHLTTGYKMVSIGKNKYYVHRLVYESKNGKIGEGLVIDHLDSNKKNNCIDNLEAITPQENCKRAAKNRDYTFIKKIRISPKKVMAINKETEEIRHYTSMYKCQKDLCINSGIIKMVCERTNCVKNGISKKDKTKWTFIYE